MNAFKLALFTLLSILALECQAFTLIPVPRGRIAYLQMVKSKGNKPEATTSKKEADTPKLVPKIGFGALFQLITMGAGAPSLGEYKSTDENGKMFFELEANNLVDSDGNSLQTKARYFTDGYIEDRDQGSKPPGFFQNLLSGGKLQEEWENSLKK